jgi:protease-4
VIVGALVRLVVNLLGLVWVALRNLPRIPRVLSRPAWVRIDVKDPLPSRPPPRRWFRRMMPSLAALSRGCDRLVEDPRLAGVVIRLGHVSGGWARAQTIRRLIERLRGGGKRVVVHLSGPGLREYYVASAADSIVVDETAPLQIVGLAAETTFFGGALAKLGARAEAEYRGEYKSFAETFTRGDMSAAHREALDAILDALAAEVRRAVATGRGITEEAAERLLAGGPYTAAEAREHGLVDAVKYLDEVDAWLSSPDGAPGAGAEGGKDRRTKVRVAPYGAWAASRWIPFRWRPLFRRSRVVRVLALHGSIVNGEGTDFPRRTLGGEAASRALDAARKDRRVAAVVLHVDSRGGSAAASDQIWRQTVRLAKDKPVVACFDDVAGSGGYYLACAADRIVAQPGTLTGSIGVVAGKLNLAGLWERLGLRTVILTRGDAAGMFHPSRGFSDDERERLAREVDALYRQFVRKVAEGRRLSPEAAEAAARGRVWIGAHAKERGLVDALGDVDDAVRIARELAAERTKRREKLEVEDAAVVPRRRGLLSRLVASSVDGHPASPIEELAERLPFSLAGERVMLLADWIDLR